MIWDCPAQHHTLSNSGLKLHQWLPRCFCPALYLEGQGKTFRDRNPKNKAVLEGQLRRHFMGNSLIRKSAQVFMGSYPGSLSNSRWGRKGQKSSGSAPWARRDLRAAPAWCIAASRPCSSTWPAREEQLPPWGSVVTDPRPVTSCWTFPRSHG